MSATGKQPLANSIVAIWVAVEGMDAPDGVAAVFLAVRGSVGADKPRATLNKRFAQLKKSRPDIFYQLHLWLERPEVKQAARNAGALGAWRIWRQASFDIHQGAKAHAAFGMNVGGRPKSPGFTLAEDAAIYAIHSVRAGQAADEGSAIHVAATIYRARVDDIQKALPMAQALSNSDLASAVGHSVAKRK
jgi:hypothetical protein